MTARKTSRKRGKKKPAKKPWIIPGIGRLLIFFVLFFLLMFSLCSAGYVVFFRTVFAQEIMPVLKSSIVFEEPDPPQTQGPLELAVEEEAPLPLPEDPIIGKEAELPKVALIIDDMGYHYAIGKQLLEMPLELTFSFLPFATDTRELEELAYHLGKTIFLHLPLEPQSDKFDPGPGALLLSDSSEVRIQKIRNCLQEVPHAVGVNNHMGSRFTENRPAMDGLMVELSKQSLYFVDSYTTSASVGLESARSYNIKSARRNVFLDNITSEEQICGQLEKLVNIAKEKGTSIGIAHPHTATLEALKNCAPGYESEIQYVSIVEIL